MSPSANKSFDPSKDIPSLAGKVLFITGGTAGLGAGSVLELAKHSPAHIFFSGRNQKAADALVAKIPADVKATFIRCDVSSFASVREAAATFLRQSNERLDVLMLNAGIMATPPETSADGYEKQFATNHLGQALLVDLLLPALKAAGPAARVVNMTSIAYKQAPTTGINFATLKSSQAELGNPLIGHRWARYGQSKLAQMLYSRELARHHPGITSVSVHPGFIMTGLFDGLPLLTTLPVMLMSIGKRTPVEEGHYNQCWAATCDKSELMNGGYYEPIGAVTKPSTKQAKDEKLAERLWEWTQEQIRSAA